MSETLAVQNARTIRLPPGSTLSRCPYCGRTVQLQDKTIVGGCRHFRGIDQLEDGVYVEFGGLPADRRPPV